MNYSLSTAVIADTVHALAAVELLSADSGSRNSLAPLLRNPNPGSLTLLIRNSFARIVLDLLPFVISSSLDGESASQPPPPQRADDPPEDHLLEIELKVPETAAGDSGGLHGVIRRHIETAVVWDLIDTVAPGTARASRRTDALSALRALLSPPMRPIVRSPSY